MASQEEKNKDPRERKADALHNLIEILSQLDRDGLLSAEDYQITREASSFIGSLELDRIMTHSPVVASMGEIHTGTVSADGRPTLGNVQIGLGKVSHILLKPADIIKTMDVLFTLGFLQGKGVVDLAKISREVDRMNEAIELQERIERESKQ